MSDAHAFAVAAEALIDTPFRFRGRDPLTGLDCIGLVAASLMAIGREVPPLPHYEMRNLDRARFEGLLEPLGFLLSTGHTQAGDLILLQPSAAQLHLVIVGPSSGLIHAHGGLGRVVVSPPPLAWPQVARWRLHTT